LLIGRSRYGILQHCLGENFAPSDPILVDLVVAMSPYEYAEGRAVFVAGDVGHSLYILLHGHCERRYPPEGEAAGQSQPLEIGTCFGDEPMLRIGWGPDGRQHNYSVVSTGPGACRVGQITTLQMQTLFQKHRNLEQVRYTHAPLPVRHTLHIYGVSHTDDQ
jgi:hypothetical protein